VNGTRFAALLAFLALVPACSGGSPSPTPTPQPSPTPSPMPTAASTPTPSPPATDEPPERDLFDLALRFRGLPPDTPRLARDAPFDYSLGDREELSIVDISGASQRTASASLRHITDHAYFFVEDGAQVAASTLQRIGDDFESTIYPAVTSAFGPVRSPGVDADPRISIVHADLAGAGGYVTLSDAFPKAASPRSNEREAVYLETSALSVAGPAYNALLAHELQHLVHQDGDAGEEAWVNEGLSQVAAELAGGGTSRIPAFLAAPDTQLNDWTAGGGLHYGKSQLFFRYLLDRFGGRQNAARLVTEPLDGIDGVAAYLQGFDMTFGGLFADWCVANYLDDDSQRFGHQGAELRVTAKTAIAGPGQGEDTVHQFAADYLEIDPPAAGGVLTIDGSDEVGIGIEPQDGAFWWSNAGDSIDTRLTRELDLSGLDSATLRFRVRFATELGWDYGYIAASTDSGATWRALPGRHTSDYNPVGLAYGPGYTGDSGGEWLDEEIDLTPFAGGELLLRLEYVTDDATHGRGLAIDDISIPELGFEDDADNDAGWQAQGFRRIERPLEQRFLVRLIEPGDPAGVTRVPVNEGNLAQVLLGPEPAVVVVMAVTDGTTEPAGYRWSLSEG
jgi:immune inhibitor A